MFLVVVLCIIYSFNFKTCVHAAGICILIIMITCGSVDLAVDLTCVRSSLFYAIT